MSLDWNVKKIENHKELCFEYRENGEEGPGDYVKPLTERLIWKCMAVGLSGITEKNWSNFLVRASLLDWAEGRPPLTVEEVRSHIGLSTNVSRDTDAAWLKSFFQYEKYMHEKKLAKKVA
jgi:hypothetical protein